MRKEQGTHLKKPLWLKTRLPVGSLAKRTSSVIKGLNTVCESARCPNKGECFSLGTATFLILGNKCTRNCSFCAVESKQPSPPDKNEPKKIALSVKKLNLNYVVITSVTRDDLPFYGADIFAETILKIKEYNDSCGIEVLIPDFKGKVTAIKKVTDAKPDVISHNLETVKRLYPKIRDNACYDRSINLLKEIKKINPKIKTKSGIMLGHSEKDFEIIGLMKDLRNIKCDILTIGQYLQPTKKNIPVHEYVLPKKFDELKKKGKKMGFIHVEAGPLVRSSYKAERQLGT